MSVIEIVIAGAVTVLAAYALTSTRAVRIPPKGPGRAESGNGGRCHSASRSEFMIKLQMLSMRMATHWPVRPLLEKQFGKADDLVLPAYAALPAH